MRAATETVRAPVLRPIAAHLRRALACPFLCLVLSFQLRGCAEALARREPCGWRRGFAREQPPSHRRRSPLIVLSIVLLIVPLAASAGAVIESGSSKKRRNMGTRACTSIVCIFVTKGPSPKIMHARNPLLQLRASLARDLLHEDLGCLTRPSRTVLPARQG